MKTLREYFLAEDGGATNDSSESMASPLSTAGSNGPDPLKTRDGKRELKIGDFVKVIDKKVYGYGDSGQIVNMDSDEEFVIVRLQNGIEHQYDLEALEFDPYTAEEDGISSEDRSLRNLKIMAGITPPGHQ